MPTEPFAPGTTIGLGTLAVGFPDVSDLDTTYAEADGAYIGRCSSADDADVLQIEPTGGAPDLNAVPTPAGASISSTPTSRSATSSAWSRSRPPPTPRRG